MGVEKLLLGCPISKIEQIVLEPASFREITVYVTSRSLVK